MNDKNLTTKKQSCPGANSLESMWKNFGQRPVNLDQWLHSSKELFHPNAIFNVGSPFEQSRGLEETYTSFIYPLFSPFKYFERKPYISLKGEFEGSIWISQTGYYEGILAEPLFDINPPETEIYLRFGEFFKIKENRISDCHILLDILDFIIRYAPERVKDLDIASYDGELIHDYLVPGPLQTELGEIDASKTKRSLELVHNMIFNGLAGFESDKNDLTSMNMDTYFCQNLKWYGPGGIGTCSSLKAFQEFHQGPFLESFPDRIGGNHVSRIGQNSLVASTGWPSINATVQNSYLGLEPKNMGSDITMRVMDWWRVGENNKLVENWVLIDMLNLFQQFGISHARFLSSKF